MIEGILYKTAIYCRVSSDDGSLGDSGSIKTQKMILEKYCADINFSIKDIYIDVDYSIIFKTAKIDVPELIKLIDNIK